MIRDRRVLIPLLKTGVSDFPDGRVAVAPLRVHLQVAAVLLKTGACECGIREHAADLGAAEKVPPQLPSPVDLGAAFAAFDRLFDGR
jgi:hypothetical protein